MTGQFLSIFEKYLSKKFPLWSWLMGQRTDIVKIPWLWDSFSKTFIFIILSSYWLWNSMIVTQGNKNLWKISIAIAALNCAKCVMLDYPTNFQNQPIREAIIWSPKKISHVNMHSFCNCAICWALHWHSQCSCRPAGNKLVECFFLLQTLEPSIIRPWTDQSIIWQILSSKTFWNSNTFFSCQAALQFFHYFHYWLHLPPETGFKIALLDISNLPQPL